MPRRILTSERDWRVHLKQERLTGARKPRQRGRQLERNQGKLGTGDDQPEIDDCILALTGSSDLGTQGGHTRQDFPGLLPEVEHLCLPLLGGDA